tara:strand:- start:1996 stop:2448 length:453 start_codon:yes stop_codon:yes gene_type:complete
MEIGAAVAAVKGALDLARTAKDVNDRAQLNAAMSDIMDKLTTAQSDLLDLLTEHHRLIDENRQLNQRLSKEERFNLYRLERTSTGDFVMPLKDEHVSNEQPAHVICPTCKENDRWSVMNEDEYWYRCSSCQYVAGKKKQPPPRRHGPMAL